MTIRTRNRLTLSLFFISLFIFLFSLILTAYQLLNGTFTLPDVYIEKTIKNSFLLSYNPKCTLIAILVLQAYTCLTAFIIYRSFAKTQATDVYFFLFFLLSCILNSTRILFPLFKITTNYSRLILMLGNTNMFARLLAPLSLLGAAVLSIEEFRQNADRNCIIILITTLFFTQLIPLNNAVVLPNFCISYGYVHLVRSFSCIICILDTITLFLSNKKNEYNQITTIGFFLLSVAYSIMFYCYNLLGLIFGPILMAIGTTMYLNELHNHYLWND